jgi:DtxR family Mn-dependent transcriptional regulator
MANSISIENYLNIIYKYRDAGGGIKGNVIAEQLNISGAAVTDMLKKLSRDKLIEYSPYKEIKLTPQGESAAVNLVRRHRIWEKFLFEFVKMPWEQVHIEAERLEHHSSDLLIDRLEELMHFPEFDPHGAPIPNKEGSLPKQRKLKKLSEIHANEKCTVRRVNDFDPDFLTYISSIGIKLLDEIKVLEIMKFDNSFVIEVHGKHYTISETVTNNIFVSAVKD